MSDNVFQLDANVDFGDDLGQDFGSLLEARDADGRVVCGAGFTAVYNTCYRNDRLALQFFIRQPAGENRFAKDRLPRSTTDSGVYIFDYDGRLHARSCSGSMKTVPYRIQRDSADVDPSRRVRVWDADSGQWHDDPDFGQTMQYLGDGKMRVAGKTLAFSDSRVVYDGKMILSPPAEGIYHHFYYALGTLIFFHTGCGNVRLLACPWRPGQTVDIDGAVTITMDKDREFPFAIGHHGGEIVASTNWGWNYIFDGRTWRLVHAWRGPGSYQLYSAIHWYDKLLLAHYPSGHLLEHDGGAGKLLSDFPPRMQGVSDEAREAQTTMIYGGDLFVGVWPWAEIWRYDADADQWHFMTRLLDHPEPTDQMVHPYDDRISEYNAAHNADFVPNGWGQRNTGMTTVGDSLMASSSAKWPWPADTDAPFLTDEQRADYGVITQLTIPGCITAPVQWTGKPTRLSLIVTDDAMRIEQDGRVIAQTAIEPELADRTRDAKLQPAHGVFGPFAGKHLDIAGGTP
jgi:hypothetical protein